MSTLRPMSDAEYATWFEQAVRDYAADKVASGQWAQAQALALSRKEHDELLPQGMRSADNHLFTITNTQAEPVGMLWFAVQTRWSTPIAYVYDIAIWPEHQRQGHASRALLALEQEARARGLHGVALHVFGHNSAARALYAKLGYLPTNISLYKAVVPAG